MEYKNSRILKREKSCFNDRSFQEIVGGVNKFEFMEFELDKTKINVKSRQQGGIIKSEDVKDFKRVCIPDDNRKYKNNVVPQSNLRDELLKDEKLSFNEDIVNKKLKSSYDDGYRQAQNECSNKAKVFEEMLLRVDNMEKVHADLLSTKIVNLSFAIAKQIIGSNIKHNKEATYELIKNTLEGQFSDTSKLKVFLSQEMMVWISELEVTPSENVVFIKDDSLVDGNWRIEDGVQMVVMNIDQLISEMQGSADE